MIPRVRIDVFLFPDLKLTPGQLDAAGVKRWPKEFPDDPDQPHKVHQFVVKECHQDEAPTASDLHDAEQNALRTAEYTIRKTFAAYRAWQAKTTQKAKGRPKEGK